MTEARHAAIETLLEIERTARTAKQVWDGARAGAETTIVLGVLRRRGTLDAILRAGLFELLFMQDSPVHAVVNAAVESAKRLGRFKDLGFVNAVLRAAMRGRKHDLVFDRSVFPNPDHDPVGYLAARGSTARWIAKRRHAELGFERALAVLELQASTPPLFVRSDIELDLPPGPNPGLYVADARLGDLFERHGAHIVVQDAVASQVAPFVAPRPGARVLDYCAAPGGKATHLAQLVGPTGHVTAWDADAGRLAMVAENAERLGLRHLACEEPGGTYDAVLVDAPCSNTGVLARRPEARWRVKERHLRGMAERQLAILRRAAAFVAPSGTLVYSTCSLEPEENLGVAEASGFEVLETRTVYPDEACGDGGFMARLRT